MWTTDVGTACGDRFVKAGTCEERDRPEAMGLLGGTSC
jgi:hypothetical protein